jgi:hypothetical protein
MMPVKEAPMLLALALVLAAGVHIEANAKVNGRIVDVRVRLVNEGPPLTLVFPDAQIYDFELHPLKLRWSDDRMFSKGISERRFPSGVREFRDRWILPPTIEPGDYTLRIWLTNRGGPALATSLPITIAPPR